MTEGPLHHEKPMCVRIWLEVGHACEPRQSSLGSALALDWRVWVRGAGGVDISAFVHKVVFYLHPASAFVYPKRVIQAPPYEIQESGCASIEIPIHVFLKHSERPRRIRLRYSLCAESASRGCSESHSVCYDVENPSEALWRELVRAGGEVVARTDTRARPADRLVVLFSDAEERPKPRLMKHKYKFAEPKRRRPKEEKQDKLKKSSKSVEDVSSGRFGEAVGAEFRRQLGSVLSEDEVSRAWRLFAAVARYERAPHALPLPPLSDPIYRLPELPPALTSVEADLAML